MYTYMYMYTYMSMYMYMNIYTDIYTDIYTGMFTDTFTDSLSFDSSYPCKSDEATVLPSDGKSRALVIVAYHSRRVFVRLTVVRPYKLRAPPSFCWIRDSYNLGQALNDSLSETRLAFFSRTLL